MQQLFFFFFNNYYKFQYARPGGSPPLTCVNYPKKPGSQNCAVCVCACLISARQKRQGKSSKICRKLPEGGGKSEICTLLQKGRPTLTLIQSAQHSVARHLVNANFLRSLNTSERRGTVICYGKQDRTVDIVVAGERNLEDKNYKDQCRYRFAPSASNSTAYSVLFF